MRVVAFITEGRVIRRILDHLGGAKRPQRALRKPSPGGPAPLRCRPPRPFEPVPTISRTAAENQTYPFRSSVRSATMPFSLLFSSRSWRSSRSSGIPSPPYFFFHRKYVASLTPIFRQISSIGAPASPCRSAIAICSSVNRLFLIDPSFLPLPRASRRTGFSALYESSSGPVNGVKTPREDGKCVPDTPVFHEVAEVT